MLTRDLHARETADVVRGRAPLAMALGKAP